MDFGTPHWINDVVARIEAKLVADDVFRETRIFPYLGDPTDLLANPPAEQFGTIAPESLVVEQGQVTGIGKTDTPFDAEFRVDIFARTGADSKKVDRRIFLDKAESLAKLLKAVCDSLQMATLDTQVSGRDVSALTQPMRLLRIQFNPRKTEPGWSWCRTWWSAPFRASFG